MAHQDTPTPSISSYLAVTWQLLGSYLAVTSQLLDEFKNQKKYNLKK